MEASGPQLRKYDRETADPALPAPPLSYFCTSSPTMAKREAHAEPLLPQRACGAFHGLYNGFYGRLIFGVIPQLTLVFSGPRTPCSTLFRFSRHCSLLVRRKLRRCAAFRVFFALFLVDFFALLFLIFLRTFRARPLNISNKYSLLQNCIQSAS